MPFRLLPPALSKVLPGLLLVTLGTLFLLDNFNVIEIRWLWKLWPLILIGFGISMVLESGRHNRVPGAVLLALGVWLQLAMFGLISVSVREIVRLWPLILIYFGVRLALRPRDTGAHIGGAVLLIVGGYHLVDNFYPVRFELWQLWPLALVAAGIALLREAMSRRSIG